MSDIPEIEKIAEVKALAYSKETEKFEEHANEITKAKTEEDFSAGYLTGVRDNNERMQAISGLVDELIMTADYFSDTQLLAAEIKGILIRGRT